MTDVALDVDNVSKSFGSTIAVDRVSLRVADGEIVVLVGPSGCGKSSLLRTIAGLYAAESGSISIAGVTVDDGRRPLPPEKRKVGLVFQDHALFPHLSVEDNVGFGVRMSAADRTSKVGQMLSLVGLASHGGRYPHELSGGERQRVALARALAIDPALMLLDEPFASLDPNLRAQLRHDVVGILRSSGTPAVFVTHDQDEALAVGDRIAVMHNGRLAQLDRPESVFHEPVSRFVAAFMGEADFLAPETFVELFGDNQLAATAGTSSKSTVVMVRPDDIGFAVDPAGPSTIIEREFRGSSWCYTLAFGDELTVRSLRPHLDQFDIGTVVRPHVVAGHQPVSIPTD